MLRQSGQWEHGEWRLTQDGYQAVYVATSPRGVIRVPSKRPIRLPEVHALLRRFSQLYAQLPEVEE